MGKGTNLVPGMGVKEQLTQAYQQGQTLPEHEQRRRTESKRKTQADDSTEVTSAAQNAAEPGSLQP